MSELEKIAIEVEIDAQKQADARMAEMAAKIKMYAKQMKADLATVAQGLRMDNAGNPQAIKAIDDAEKSLKKIVPAANKAESAVGAFFSRISAILTSHLILATFTAIVNFFQGVFAVATEYRGKMAELNFAEAILSKKGMDITRKEIDQFITDIQTKFKYVSKLDATSAISTVASMGAEFKLTKANVTGLAEAITFLQLKERAYGMEVSKAGSIVNAALDGRSNYFNALGINITKTAIKEKAYAMGLVQEGAAISKEMSNQAAIALLIEQTSGKYDELITSIERVDPALANQLTITKAMSDAQLDVGKATLDVTNAWNNFLSVLIENGGFDALKGALISVIESLADFIGLLTDGYKTYTDLQKSLQNSQGVESFGSKLEKWIGPLQTVLTLLQLMYLGFTTIVGAIVTAIGALSEFFSYATGAKSYEEAGRAIGQHFSDGLLNGIAIGLKPLVNGKDDPIANSLRDTMKLLGKDVATPNQPDTPQGAGDTGEGEVDNGLQEALDKMNKEILDAQIKFSQDMQDVAIDLGRKMEDITLEYARKRAEIEKEYADKIRDINSAYSDKIRDIKEKQAEENEKARNDELKREREFQNKMQEMKEKFLMDLEDALHARDARQILKLIRQYNLEKLQAERKHKLDDQNAKEEEKLRKKKAAQELKEAEEERKKKLEIAQQEYADKMAKLKADEEAEVAAAVLAANRKIQDLEKANADRLAVVAANLVAEYNLTQAGLQALVDLYGQYYTEVSAIYAAMQTMMTGMGMGMGGFGGYGKASEGLLGGNSEAPGSRSMAASFGDAGVNLATFTPLNRTGVSNKISSSLSSGGRGGSGKISIELLLSPDLESRIVNNSLNRTADIIFKTSRSK